MPTAPFAGAHAVIPRGWREDSSELLVLVEGRGHRTRDLLAVDRETGEVRTVIAERSETFVDYSAKSVLMPCGDGTLLWASERDGRNHLYRYDVATGAAQNRVTTGEFVVRRVEKVADGRVWFAAGGAVPGQDPYFLHLCRVDLDGGNFAVLTSCDAEPGDGTHEWEFTPDGRFLIDRFSRTDLPPVTLLRDAETGGRLCELSRAGDAAKRALGWRPPVRRSFPGRDGETPICGHAVFPPGFDPATAAARSVPVVEKIYAGPQDQHVPKSWGDERDVRELAALGFAVVRIDGMGTNWRSKAFHDVCWRDLGDAGLPDRRLWIAALAAEFPALDLSRVGIFGGSAGGQNALRAVLDHGDFYRAAAADCGCHDNRVDKRWWNEAWMGDPTAEGGEEAYVASSNAVDAAKLTRPLLLSVGLRDRNVDPAATWQVVDALIAAGKNFDLLAFPRGGHGARRGGRRAAAAGGVLPKAPGEPDPGRGVRRGR